MILSYSVNQSHRGAYSGVNCSSAVGNVAQDHLSQCLKAHSAHHVLINGQISWRWKYTPRYQTTYVYLEVGFDLFEHIPVVG